MEQLGQFWGYCGLTSAVDQARLVIQKKHPVYLNTIYLYCKARFNMYT